MIKGVWGLFFCVSCQSRGKWIPSLSGCYTLCQHMLFWKRQFCHCHIDPVLVKGCFLGQKMARNFPQHCQAFGIGPRVSWCQEKVCRHIWLRRMKAGTLFSIVDYCYIAKLYQFLFVTSISSFCPHDDALTGSYERRLECQPWPYNHQICHCCFRCVYCLCSFEISRSKIQTCESWSWWLLDRFRMCKYFRDPQVLWTVLIGP